MSTTPALTSEEKHEELKRQWLDQLVVVDPERPELRRFGGIVGRVVTINWNLRALVDFQDGGWYDIAPDYLVKVEAAEARAKYDPKVNSAQPFPEKQG
jgi:hypothetical protein